MIGEESVTSIQLSPTHFRMFSSWSWLVEIEVWLSASSSTKIQDSWWKIIPVAPWGLSELGKIWKENFKRINENTKM